MANKKNLMINLALVALIAASCAKKLPDEHSDAVKDNTYPKELFSQSVVVTVDGDQSNILAVEAEEAISGIWALNSKKVRKVVSVEGNELLARFVKDLELESTTPGQKIKINFKLTKNNVIGFVDEENISTVSEHSRRLLEKGRGVPVFQFGGVSWGILERQLNSNDEATRHIDFDETEDRKSATHIKVSTKSGNFEYGGLRTTDLVSKNDIFLINQLNAKYFSLDQVKALSPKHDVLNEENSSIANANILKAYLTTDNIYFHTVVNKETLSVEERKKLNQGIYKNVLKRCSKEDKQKFAFSAKLKDCVTKAIYKKSLTLKTQKRDEDEINSGEYLATVTLEDSKDGAKTLLAEIDHTNQLEAFTSTNVSEIHKDFDGKTLLKVGLLAGKEFFYRKVLIDAPNTFEVTFSGTATDVVIVKMGFEEGEVSLKRSRNILGKDGETNAEEESLLTFPAKYYKLVKEIDGRTLLTPKYIEVKHNEPGAVAAVDFSQNGLTNDLYSILDSYYKACFNGTTETKITDVFNGNRDGKYMLNLTVNTKRGINQRMCGSDSEAGDHRNMKFKERISLMEYKKGEETTDLNIPFDVQKKLGFGFFTDRKLQKIGFNQDTGSEKSNVYLPSRFDIKGCKQITYVMAGIPLENGDKNNGTTDLRKRLISSSNKVINDLNKGFKKALAGTPLDRSKCSNTGKYLPVLKLAIEKDASIAGTTLQMCRDYETKGKTANCKKLVLPVVEKREMGDLDRNYIYYMQKSTSYPILGLGGAHNNPQNGDVVSASVYQYGGNMKNSIDWMIDSYKAHMKWAKLTEPTKALIKAAEADATETESVETEGSTASANEDKVNEAQRNAAARMKDIRSKKLLTSFTNTISIKDRLLLDFKDRMVEAGGQKKITEEFETLLTAKKLFKEAMLYQELLENASSPEKIESIILKHKNPTAFKKREFLENIQWKQDGDKKVKRNICLKSKDTALISSIITKLHKGYNIVEISKSKHGMNKILIDTWRPTLAHEIGHNIGLRHNFIASYDKYNHKFDEKDSSKRNYSSVMDYMIDDHITYDGLGPYDVHAIRAGYTGLLELNPTSPAADFAKTEIEGKKFIHVNTVKALLGLDVWINIDDEKVKEIGLKKYAFCSDMEAYYGLTPTCQRHDWGTSPEEIVDYTITSTEAIYSEANLVGDSKSFSASRQGRIFSNYSRLRSFNEEFLYKRFKEAPLFFDYSMLREEDLSKFDIETRKFIEEDRSYIAAIFKTFDYLESKVRQPGLSANVKDKSSLRRYVPLTTKETITETNEEGVEVTNEYNVTRLIQTKSIETISLDGLGQRNKVKGVDIERIIALIFLTQKEGVTQKHQINSLDFPYYLLSDDLAARIEKLEAELLLGELTPATMIDGKMVELEAPFTTRITDFLQTYSAITSTMYLDVEDLDSETNIGRKFRILSERSSEAPSDVAFQEAKGDKFFYPSAEDATVAIQMIEKANELNALIKNGVSKSIEEIVKLEKDQGEETLFATDDTALIKNINGQIVGNPGLVQIYNLSKADQLKQIAEVKASILKLIGVEAPVEVETETPVEVTEAPADATETPTEETETPVEVTVVEAEEETEPVEAEEEVELTEEQEAVALEEALGQYNLFTIIAVNKELVSKVELDAVKTELVTPYIEVQKEVFNYNMKKQGITTLEQLAPGQPPVEVPLNMETINSTIGLAKQVADVSKQVLEVNLPLPFLGETQATMNAEIAILVKRECIEGCKTEEEKEIATNNALMQRRLIAFEKLKGYLTTIAKSSPIKAIIIDSADTDVEVTQPFMKAFLGFTTPSEKLSVSPGINITTVRNDTVNNIKFLERLYFMSNNK
ncbi:hypothetical protein A9Q84_17205 [Halobacteriovorax marinus]|uniref:EcxA zinc-binding domain-containing protein n=1 Tax=Halobacteriovorax marinus TaxID=97084 RepID=A0A1Y5F929_9BACT|nr:hypothetical protein A9Q84_17205 [Halobacteriovorax marinus]